MSNHDIELSIVLPIYNEAATIPFLLQRLSTTIPPITQQYEVIFVDDGSKDNSFALLKEAAAHNPHYKVIHLSRNFGHQIAITCGLDHASGKATLVMDADLQDPPELIATMYSKWQQGANIVIAKREKRCGETWFKKYTAWLFYRLLAMTTDVPIVLDAGDFYLLDHQVLNVVKSCHEKARFLRGLVANAGFKTEIITYQRLAREHGKTSYSLSKMLHLAKDAWFGFSTKPIFIIHCLTALALITSFIMMLYAVATSLIRGFNVPGWATLVILISFFNGLVLLGMSILGEYIYRIFRETQNRPLYFIDTIVEYENNH